MAKNKKDRSAPTINASSMADIAFLLLIFFLVTTTMDVDKGVTIKLPPITEEPPEDVEIHERNAWPVLVNANDQLLVKGELVRVEQLREKTKRFIGNFGRDPKLSLTPQKAVVSLKTDRGTSYNMYVQVLNELKAAYNELREEEARQEYGVAYEDLTKEQKKKVRKKYPMRLSIAEPESVGG